MFADSHLRHFLRKSRHSPRPGTGHLPEKLLFPLLPRALHLVWGRYAANSHLHIEKIPSKASTQLFNLQRMHLQTEDVEKLEDWPLLTSVSDPWWPAYGSGLPVSAVFFSGLILSHPGNLTGFFTCPLSSGTPSPQQPETWPLAPRPETPRGS